MKARPTFLNHPSRLPCSGCPGIAIEVAQYGRGDNLTPLIVGVRPCAHATVAGADRHHIRHHMPDIYAAQQLCTGETQDGDIISFSHALYVNASRRACWY